MEEILTDISVVDAAKTEQHLVSCLRRPQDWPSNSGAPRCCSLTQMTVYWHTITRIGVPLDAVQTAAGTLNHPLIEACVRAQ